MWWKIFAFVMLCGGALGYPALAQTQPPAAPPAGYWDGPWFMWGGGWASFWWICPLMMLVMVLAMMFACRFMGSWHRD